MAESILDAAAEQLTSAGAKITYLGEQTKPIGTVIFYSRGHEPAMEDFLRVQRMHRPYTNDRSPYTSHFAVEAEEFRRMLSALKPLLTGADVAGTHELLSFSVVRTTGGRTVGQEFHIGAQLAREFYAALIDALNKDNPVGRAILEKQFSAVCP
ncbi:MAG: hypothetical protein ABSC21_19065 [Terriglobia bacterium]|jgi:hypothetical protein